MSYIHGYFTGFPYKKIDRFVKCYRVDVGEGEGEGGGGGGLQAFIKFSGECSFSKNYVEIRKYKTDLRCVYAMRQN